MFYFISVISLHEDVETPNLFVTLFLVFLATFVTGFLGLFFMQNICNMNVRGKMSVT